MKKIIENFFKNNFDKMPKSVAVALSGGIDSMALTFLLNEFCLKNKIKLHAITIDHKMRKSSSNEALQLSKIMEKNKIKHQILTISKKNIPQKNIEANLREARYDLLYEYCIKNKISELFLGHHQEDLAENFLIRLFRGSQLDGLSAMKEMSQFNKIKLCRPFLNNNKNELKQYLIAKKISWFEDETNDDEKFLRNKIRKFFNQFEEKNLIQERIKKTAEMLDEMREMFDEILLEKAKKILIFNDDKFFLDIEEYKKIPRKIALKILSLVLIEVSGKSYKPRLESLRIFEENILNLQKNQKRNFYGCMAKIVAQNKTFLVKTKLGSLEGDCHGRASLRPRNDKNRSRLCEERSDAAIPFETCHNSQDNKQKIIAIYRDEKSPKNKAQQFDEETKIIDGRFLQKKDSTKFYFRTILGELF